MDERWWIKGDSTRQVDIVDRGLTYADGLFETIAIRSGVARFLPLHLERLRRGCNTLGIPLPPDEVLGRQAADIARGAGTATLKILVTRGPGPRGYAPPANPDPTIAFGLLPSTAPAGDPGIRVRLCHTPAAWSPAVAGIKTLGRLENVLARAELRPGDGEGLMADPLGRLVGGTSSNLFCVIDGLLCTPPLAGAGVHGIMRRVTLDACREAGIPATEREMTINDLAGASEIFLTNALTGIRPVTGIGPRALAVGPVTRQLRGILAAIGVIECAAAC